LETHYLDSLKTTNEITPISVLHIDDDPSILEITKLMLENIDDNIRIEQACSVDEGLQKVSIGQYDVVVSDYEMPQKDGLKFLKELRELNNKIGFILFTGKGREEVAIQALNLGADGYINKQNNPETVYGELAHTINRVANQRNTEKTLFLERKRLELVSKNIGAGLTIISKDYHILWANKLLTDLFGEITAKTCYSTLNNQTNVCSGCGVKKIFETEAAQFVHEQKVPGADGKTAWLEITATAIKDEAGKVTSALEMAIDITERKRAEEEIKSMSRFPDENPFAILRIDKNGTLLFINPSGQKLFDHLELKVGNHVPEQWQKKVTKTLESKLRTNFEQEVNGSLFSFSATPIVSQGYVNIYAKDITENKKAEEAANADAVLRSTLLDNVPCIALVLDKKTRIIVASNKIAQEIGALPGKTCFETCAKGSFPCPFCLAPNLWATNEKQVLEEVEYNGKYYKGVWMPYTKDLYIHYIFDITQAKQNEEKQRLSDEQFRQLFSSMPSGVAVYEVVDDGKDFVFKDFNPSAEKIENISKDNVIGKRVSEVFPGVESFGIHEVFQRVWQTGQPEYYPAAIYKDDKDPGSWRENWVYKLPNGNIVAIYNDITKRKEIENSFIDSQKRFQDLLETTGEFIWEMDSQGRYTYCSPQMEKTWGLKPKEMLGKSPFDVMPPNERIKALELFGTMGSSPKPFSGLQTTAYNSQGNLIFVETNGVPFFNDKGNLLGYRGISRDITEFKKAEEKIKESEKRSRAIVDNSPIGIATVGADKHFLTANENFCKILGYSEDELLKLSFKDITYPTDLKESVIKMGELENNNVSSFSLEKRYVKKDGAVMNGKIMVSVLRNQNGTPRLFIAELEDITERKQMETNLLKSKAMLNEIEKTGKIGGWEFDVNTLAQTWTDETFHILEFDRSHGEPIVPKGIEFINPPYRSMAAEVIQRAIAHGEPYDQEWEITTLKGNKRWVHAVAKVNWENGKIKTISGSFQDITERKKVEENLREISHNNELTNEKLRVVGSLTRHDVGNKLMIIQSNLYLLKKQIGDNPKITKYLEDIDAAISLSDKLFEFSRLYECIGVEKSSSENVFDCFNQAAALVMNSGSVKIVNECQGLEVLADSLIKQLFYNFIDNSLKHGEKVTQIRLHYAKDGDGVKLFYEDNGVGVPEANKARLFEAGFSTGGSTGLGLYLVKKMMDVYGWTITEEGEAGKGAKFVITISKLNKNGKENYQIIQ
jgi:PAS domain S-box-containing protein